MDNYGTVIFLDVDGVLNSMHTPAWMREDWDVPLARPLQNLKYIVDKTGAKIVVTSSWREYPAALRKLEIALMVFELPIAGRTPALSTNRPNEIETWLNKHPEVKRYVILDDEPQPWTSEQLNKVVPVNPSQALTAQNAQLAVLILTDDDIWMNQERKENYVS